MWRKLLELRQGWLPWAFVLLCLTGCGAFSDSGAVATIDAELLMYATEGSGIQAAATAEQSMLIETVVAASTRVAQVSAVNAALGATLRAIYTPTPAVRPVVVSADDMGASLGDDRMADGAENGAMQVTDVVTATATDPNSGCALGITQQFNQNTAQIFVTARVTNLQAGTHFRVIWQRGTAQLYEYSWTANISRAAYCIWFYVSPEDFAFTPGDYRAALYADDAPVGSANFAIVAS